MNYSYMHEIVHLAWTSWDKDLTTVKHLVEELHINLQSCRDEGHTPHQLAATWTANVGLDSCSNSPREHMDWMKSW